MEQEMEIIQGIIGAVVYQNYENGYAVLRLDCGGGDTVTVKRSSVTLSRRLNFSGP